MNTFTRWPSVDRSPTPVGWARPGNLMPAVGPSSWPRGRRATSEAEEILATAEAWWDVDRSGFRDGDRYLRNIGTAGSALDLRLGSSGVANSNDPKWLGAGDTSYVYLPGVAANCLSVPSSSALNITGDIDIRAQIAPDSWLGVTNTIVSKWSNQTQARAYRLLLGIDATLYLVWCYDTLNNFVQVNSTAPVPFTGSQVGWVRVVLDVDNGASGNDVKFYTSTDGVTWTQLGSTVTTAGVTSINGTSTQDLLVGAWSIGRDQNMISGKVYRAQVLNGINGTTVLDINCDAISVGSATTFTEQSSNAATVTINRATSGRKSVAMPSKAKGGRPLMLLGTDDYMTCLESSQHGLLNMNLNQSFTVLAVFRDWASTVDGSSVLCKRANTASPGWEIGVHNTSAIWFDITNVQGATRSAAQSADLGFGIMKSPFGIVNRSTQRVAITNGSTTVIRTDYNMSGWDFQNTRQFFVGRSEGTGYDNLEFFAAAIWRRALTSREIAVLNNAAPWGA